MQRRTLRWCVPLLLLTAGLIALLWNDQTRFRSFRSTPGELRSWSSYEWNQYHAEPAEPDYSSDKFFDAPRIQQRGKDIHVSPNHPVVIQPHSPSDEAPLVLDYLGIALPTPTDSQSSHYMVDRHYYDSAGQKRLNPEEHPHLVRKPLQIQSRGEWPMISLSLSKTKPAAVVGVRAFDSRSHFPLSYSKSWGDAVNRADVTLELGTWRPSDVEVALYILPDGREFRKLEPTLNSIHSFGDLQIKILHIQEDMDGSVAPRASTLTSYPTHYCYAGVPEGDENRYTGFFIAAYPYGHKTALAFRALDHEEKRIRTKRHDLAQFGYLVLCQAPTSEIAFLEVGFPLSYSTQILKLPDIPLMPEENREIDNLFDMQIPFMRVQRSRLASSLSRGAQIRTSFMTGDMRAGLDPNEYLQLENVTVWDLFNIFRDQYPANRYDFDPASHKLERKDATRFGDWWERIWPF